MAFFRFLPRGAARFVGLTVLGLVTFQGLAAAQSAVRARQVADQVWMVQGDAAVGSPANRNFISNAGFVVTEEGVLVVDALGSPALAKELIAEIRRITPLPIRYLVVTHFHADHIYGLQVFKAAGAQILGHSAGRAYLGSENARLRLQVSRQELAPWIDAQTQLTSADRWLPDASTELRLGSFVFQIRHVGPSHTPEDLAVFVPRAGVLFVGDLVFRGRVPFVGQADSRQWIKSLDSVIGFAPRIMVPGHGDVSTEPLADLALTRDYLVFLRESMGAAARNLESFDEAYARTDWSRFANMPLFRAANRMNAYNTYLLMEHQGLERLTP